MASARKRYAAMVSLREPFLDRARECAQYTQPYLLPPEGHSYSQKLTTPYQGLGSRGVNNLASKLLLILMPPNTTNFKLDVDDYQVQQMVDEGGDATRGELEDEFSRIERAVVRDLESTTIRVQLSEGLKLLLVTGNIAVVQDDEGSARVFRLDQYVCRRDPSSGNVLEVITKEEVVPETLSPEIQMACDAAPKADGDSTKVTEVYTRWLLDGNKWLVQQEINDVLVPGSEGSYPKEKTPLVVPATHRLDGEDYGRGFVEMLLGDLKTFDGLSRHLLDAAAASAKTLILRNPNGVTRAKDLERPNLSIVNGSAADVTAMRLDKGADMQVPFGQAQNISDRLEAQFLLPSSIQRSGDRVTATEIRAAASELEDALGGIYSVLARELQLPIVAFQLARLQRQKRIPQLPAGVIRPRITTGLQALGRGHDLDKIRGFISDLSQLGNPQVTEALGVKTRELTARVAAAWGVDTTDLFLSEEEQAAASQQAQMQQMMQQIGPDAANQMMGSIRDQAKQEAPNA